VHSNRNKGRKKRYGRKHKKRANKSSKDLRDKDALAFWNTYFPGQAVVTNSEFLAKMLHYLKSNVTDEQKVLFNDDTTTESFLKNMVSQIFWSLEHDGCVD